MTKTLTTDELRQIVDSHEKGYGMSVPINYGYLAARELLANREAQPVAGGSLECEDELNAALRLHRLKVEGHSQLSDSFRAGFKYARRTAPSVASGENCWSCGKFFTYAQHSECDGYCPHCNAPVDLDEGELNDEG